MENSTEEFCELILKTAAHQSDLNTAQSEHFLLFLGATQVKAEEQGNSMQIIAKFSTKQSALFALNKLGTYEFFGNYNCKIMEVVMTDEYIKMKDVDPLQDVVSQTLENKAMSHPALQAILQEIHDISSSEDRALLLAVFDSLLQHRENVLAHAEDVAKLKNYIMTELSEHIGIPAPANAPDNKNLPDLHSKEEPEKDTSNPAEVIVTSPDSVPRGKKRSYTESE